MFIVLISYQAIILRSQYMKLYHHSYRAYIKFLYQDHDTRSYITIVNVQ